MLPENKEEYDKRWGLYTNACMEARALAHDLCDSILTAEDVTNHNEDDSSFFVPMFDDNIKIRVSVQVWVSDDDYLELPEKD